MRRVITGFFREVKPKDVVRVLSRHKNETYYKNEEAMKKRLKEIKPNPGYIKADASEFNSAMEAAEKKEANSFYHR